MNFCNKCHFWEKIGPQAAGILGMCHNEHVKLKVHLDFTDIDSDEEGSLWTDEYFGCVHWMQNCGALFSISDQKK